ncbi:MAG: LPP20 family lipoprotein [Spirochaetaceae bacterium]|jgi:hypothetical protein|nr:LPP20 family lipoprotein [Spirochaetaceae bacterium]
MKKIISLVFLVNLSFAYVNAQIKPSWVDRPSSIYPDSRFVSAVGGGGDRRQAETNALGALTAFFKQSVSSRIRMIESEIEVNGRSTSSSLNLSSIEAAAALDTLIGAEIKNTWNDPINGVWYAVAVMEKAQCGALYTGELNKTIREINTLIAISDGVSFETISKCQAAQKLAAQADVYATVLALLDGPNRQQEVSELTARIAGTMNDAKAIPVDVRVNGDINGRIKAAFAGAFTSLGFRTGNRNSRFALEVTTTFTPAPQGRYFNTRYTVDAVLKDTRTGAELFTYNIGNRESHPANQSDADNRALIGAERKITEEFPEILQEYLNLSQN